MKVSGYTENQYDIYGQRSGMRPDQLAWKPTQAATLILFAPRETPNQVVRPMLYNLANTGLVDTVTSDIVAKSASPGLGGKLDVFDTDLGIVPSATGRVLSTDWLNRAWTFILFIDNDGITPTPNQPASLVTPRAFANRVIASGVCLDEPANPLQVEGHVAINTSCVLQITHMTYTTVKRKVSALGTSTIGIVQQDKDIIVPTVELTVPNHNVGYAQQSSMYGGRPALPPAGGSGYGEQYMLDPAHMLDSFNLNTEDNSVQFAPVNAGAVWFDQRPCTLPAALNVPKQHFRELMKPLYRAAKSIAEQPYLGSMYGDADVMNSVLDWQSTYDFFRNRSAQAYASLSPSVMVGLDPQEYYSIADLIAKYPFMDIKPCKSSYSLPIDAGDQSVISPETIATSLIASSVPAIMTKAGLSHVTFIYTSDVPSVIDDPNGNFAVKLPEGGLASIINEPHDVLMQRWNIFLDDMRADVFSQVEAMHGDFEVYISAQGTGLCNVQIQWLDGGTANKEWHVANTMLGGMASPVVGSLETLQHNVNEWSSVLPVMSSKVMA